MKIIAHRGNIYGPDKENENKPEYLMKAINKNLYVELDLWKIDNKLFLGHDKPQYKILIDFLLKHKEKIFCHCKNIEALHYLLSNNFDIECFFHENDECVLTSKQNIWNYTGTKLTNKSICVMPEISNQKIEKCIGVCTDYCINYLNK
tara:strand:+ start:35 stop:478 length:444 start_codon:yes stop_codon:yes gene_type:complete